MFQGTSLHSKNIRSSVRILAYQIKLVMQLMLKLYHFTTSGGIVSKRYEVYKIQVSHLPFVLLAFFTTNLDIRNTHIVEVIEARLQS